MRLKQTLVEIIQEHQEQGDTVIAIQIFENGYKLLKKYLHGGVIVCCWLIDDEYQEDVYRPRHVYDLI